MKALFVLASVGTGLVALYAIYAAMFFAWLTATPLNDVELARANYDHYAWLVVVAISAVAFVLLTIAAIKRKKKRGHH